MFPDVFCNAACNLQSAEERCVPRIEVGAGRFGDERRVFLEDGGESVVVGLYKDIECCGRGFNEFGVDDIRDEVGEVDGGKAAEGALSCRRCWGRFKVERSEDGEVVGGREWGARD